MGASASRSRANPPAARWKPPVFGLVVRLIIIAAFAGMQVIGFFVLPWVEVNLGTGWVGVGYLDYADLVRGMGGELGGWQGAYLDGLGLLLGAAAMAATLAMVLRYFLTGRSKGSMLLFILVLGGGVASLVGPDSAVETAHWRAASGSPTVAFSYMVLLLALFLESPLKPEPTPETPGSLAR